VGIKENRRRIRENEMVIVESERIVGNKRKE
jgi:hypothetical protein